MITYEALQEAIAECQGTTHPNRETCMMLAAFYTIQDHLYPQDRFADASKMIEPAYSYAPPPEQPAPDAVGDYGDSDFLQAIRGKPPGDMWAIMDELMDTLKIVNQRAYNGIMRKIQ